MEVESYNHVLADLDENHIIKGSTSRERKPPQRYEPPKASPKKLAAKEKESVMKGDQKPKAYKVMVTEAITSNASRKGATKKTITHYIASNYDVPDQYKSSVNRAIAELLNEEALVQDGSFYKIVKNKTPKKGTPLKGSPKKATPKKLAALPLSMKEPEPARPAKRVAEVKQAATPKTTPKKATPKKATPKKDAPSKSSGTRQSPRSTVAKAAKSYTTNATLLSVKEPEPMKKRVTKIKEPAKQVTKPTLKRVPTTNIEVAPKLQNPLPQVQLEMIFCFDTTGSMYDWLENVREKIGEIVARLLFDVRGIRIGIIAFGDYPQIKEEPYVIQVKDFGTDVDEIVSFVLSVDRTFGGDWEEAYELALRRARTDFTWTHGYNRALVVIGDAAPHAKDDAFNKDNIDWEEEVELLRQEQVKIYAVQCNTTNAKCSAFFEAISARTGGSHLRLDQIEELGDLLKGLAYREVRLIGAIRRHGTGKEEWHRWNRILTLQAAEVQFEAHAAEIKERISGLRRQATGAQLVLPDDVNPDNLFADEEILSIHNAIHDVEKRDVLIQGEQHNIAVGTAGCRYVRINEITFIQQNKEKDTKYARMSLEGHAITWICHEGRWGLIIDQDIVRK